MHEILRQGLSCRIINHAFTTALHSLPPLSIILPCSTNIPLSFNALQTVHPSRSWPSSQPHFSHIRSYFSFHQSAFLHSLHVSKPPQYTALLNQPTLITLVLLHTPSFLTRYICFTSHILLRHLIYITFNLFSPQCY